MFETMLNLVRVAADRGKSRILKNGFSNCLGLDIKRKLFLYSMKARLIQNVFKKYTVIMIMKHANLDF